MSKVLHICSWFPSREHPTLGNFIQRHIEAISLHHSGYVLYAAPSAQSGMEIEERDNHTIVRVYFKKRLPLLSLRQALQRGYKFILEKGFKADLVHLHVAYPAGIFVRQLNTPLIISEHFSGYQKSRGHKWSPFQKALIQKLYNQAQLFCPVTSQLGDSIKNFGIKTPYQVIGNVVNTQIFKPAPVKAKKRFRFLHISSLQNSTKNITGLLHAFKQATEVNPNIELAIGGDGDLLWLRAEVKRAGLHAQQIEILAEMAMPEVALQMQKADSFILFSHIENQPVVVLEAFCTGLPVIATKVGALPELVSPEKGILVQAANEKELTEAILKMASNFKVDKEKMVQAAHKAYSPEAIARQFSKAYLSVLP